MSRSIAVFGIVILGSWLEAQKFDVVSVKPSNPGIVRTGMRDMPGQATYTGVTVKTLIQQAYQVRDFQVVGGPGWIASGRYDIAAKPPAGGPAFPADPMKATDQQRQALRESRQAMVRAMLADRFKLRIHKEMRELPVYVLTVAKQGSKLKESNGINVSDPDLGPGMIRLNDGSLAGTQIGMAELVETLSRAVDRIILNKTELNGKYDFALRWTPDDLNAAASREAGASPPSPASTDGPSIFTALQDLMGLKLESSKGPVEVVVIDHVETPEEN